MAEFGYVGASFQWKPMMEMGNNVFLSDEQFAPVAPKTATSRVEEILEELRQLINAPNDSPAKQIGNPVAGRLQIAKKIVEDRLKRTKFFYRGYFGEPSWDILLDLYIAARESRKVTISEACIASLVPGSTALRIIRFLVKSEMIIKTPDGHDKRRAYLTLTSTGQKQMADYLDAVETKPLWFAEPIPAS